MSQYEIGQYYEVPCAVLRWKDDAKVYFIPVFDHLRNDPQFGFPHEHYHIDGRFEIHPRITHWFNIKFGHTLTVIVKYDQSSYLFEGIADRVLKCERLETGLAFNSSRTLR
jgi:hypothetical protein